MDETTRMLDMDTIMRQSIIKAYIPYPQCLMYYYIHVHSSEGGFNKKDMNRLVDIDYAYYGMDQATQKPGILPTVEGLKAAREYEEAAPTCPHCWRGKIWRKYGLVFLDEEEDQPVERYYHYCDNCGHLYREINDGDISSRTIPLCTAAEMLIYKENWAKIHYKSTPGATNDVDALIAAAGSATSKSPGYGPEAFRRAKEEEEAAEKEARTKAAREAGYMLCVDCMQRGVVRTRSGSEIIWECTLCGASWYSSNNGKSLGERITKGSSTLDPEDSTPAPGPRM